MILFFWTNHNRCSESHFNLKSLAWGERLFFSALLGTQKGIKTITIGVVGAWLIYFAIVCTRARGWAFLTNIANSRKFRVLSRRDVEVECAKVMPFACGMLQMCNRARLPACLFATETKVHLWSKKERLLFLEFPAISRQQHSKANCETLSALTHTLWLTDRHLSRYFRQKCCRNWKRAEWKHFVTLRRHRVG